jgi:hypothetical protein
MLVRVTNSVRTLIKISMTCASTLFLIVLRFVLTLNTLFVRTCDCVDPHTRYRARKLRSERESHTRPAL